MFTHLLACFELFIHNYFPNLARWLNNDRFLANFGLVVS